MRSVFIVAACCTAISLASPARALEGVVCAPADARAMFDISFEHEAPPADTTASPGPWRHVFVEAGAEAAAVAPAVSLHATDALAQEPVAPRPRAVQLSKGYEVRLKVHRLASWATAPLFVAQYVVGQELYDRNDSGDGPKGLHSALATGTAVLFGVNTVTGVWNLWEGRAKREGRTRRIIHSVLMLSADAGFVATGLTAPDSEDDGGISSSNRSTHRNVALASMGVAAASYVFMLVTR